MKYNAVQDIKVEGKTVVIRTDINVPIKNGIVQDFTRIIESFQTIEYCLSHNVQKVIIIAHFGRPKGKFCNDISFKHILPELNKIYKENVELIVFEQREKIRNSQSKIILLENIRFHKEEEENNNSFAKELALLGDIYINDAFSASHRAHASISGISQYTKVYAGLLLQDEIKNIESILYNTPKEKLCAIIGGSKVSTKFDLLNNLIHKVKYIILGGGMANTFLHSQGINVGKSLYEADYTEKCRKIIKSAEAIQTKIVLPETIVTAKEFKEGTEIEIKNVKNITNDDIITDICIEKNLEEILPNIDIVVWNGPLGVFEMKPFSCGTESIARMIAKNTKEHKIKSIIGGGDVVSAISNSGLKNSMTYISTGGGAFLEWLEGKELPGISVCKI